VDAGTPDFRRVQSQVGGQLREVELRFGIEAAEMLGHLAGLQRSLPTTCPLGACSMTM
jgi:hypothetical protein